MTYTVNLSVGNSSCAATCTAFLCGQVQSFTVPTTTSVTLKCESKNDVLKLVFTAEEQVWVLQNSLEVLEVSSRQQSSRRYTMIGNASGLRFWADLSVTLTSPSELLCPKCQLWQRAAETLQNNEKSCVDPHLLADLEQVPLLKICTSLPLALTEQDRAHLKVTLLHANEREKVGEVMQTEVDRLNEIVKELLSRRDDRPNALVSPCLRCEEMKETQVKMKEEAILLSLRIKEQGRVITELETRNDLLRTELSLLSTQQDNKQLLTAELQHYKNLLSVSEDQRMTLLRDMMQVQQNWKLTFARMEKELKQATTERESRVSELAKVKAELAQVRTESERADAIRLEQEMARIEQSAVSMRSKVTNDMQTLGARVESRLDDFLKLNESLLGDKAQVESAFDTLEDQLQEREEELQALKRQARHSELDQQTREDLQFLRSKTNAYTEATEALRSQLNSELPNLMQLLSASAAQCKSQDTALQTLKETVSSQQREVTALKELLAKPAEEYTPQHGDQVDQVLAAYLNSRRGAMPVTFQRKEPGVYLFGSKRVFIRIENGKVIIRVGGGYMNIEEFLTIYTPMEVGRALQETWQSPDQLEEKLTQQLQSGQRGFTACIGVRKRAVSGVQ